MLVLPNFQILFFFIDPIFTLSLSHHECIMTSDVTKAVPTDPAQRSSGTTEQRYIICMKWGDKYGPEYVNRL